ncbi:hypothetical protein Tco_0823721 [Tanacetum coccineum]|uniref:RNA polymerase alpha subunit n=1 Tax=Tanacetum coccineum TaxID=301880 RepID=A0ABQ5ALD3_9ASTR
MCCLNEGAFTNRLQEQPLHLPIIEVASRLLIMDVPQSFFLELSVTIYIRDLKDSFGGLRVNRLNLKRVEEACLLQYITSPNGLADSEIIDILNHASRLLKAELPLSLRLIELQQNICMSTDNIEEAVEHHISGTHSENDYFFNKNGEQEQLTKKNLIPFGFFMSKYSF